MGIWILYIILLVGSSNAVNITDGEDGLAGGLSAIAFYLLVLFHGVVIGYKVIKKLLYSALY